MKKLLLTGLIAVAAMTAMAQAPQQPQLPAVSKIQLSIPEFLSIDSAVNYINNAMTNSAMPSNVVQQLVALNNRAHAPIFNQVKAQLVLPGAKTVAPADTTKLQPKVKPKKQ